MNDTMLAYIDRVNEINRLMQRSSLVPSPGQDMISCIRQRSAQVFELQKANNRLMQDEILPLLGENVLLSPGDYQALDEFAGALCSLSAYSDPGLAFMIHKKLLACAISSDDISQQLAQRFAIGIACYLLYSEFEMFETLDVRPKVVPWFAENAAYLSCFSDLSSPNRRIVLRSLNNEALAFNPRRYVQLDEYMQTIRRTLTVFTDPEVRALEPDLNWSAYVRAVYRNTLRIADAIEQGMGLAYLPDIQQAAERLTESAAPGDAVSEIDQYGAIELANILHRLTPAQCLAQVDAIYEKRDPTLFNKQGIDQNINIPSFSLLYEVRVTPKDPARMNRKIEEIIRYVNAFHKHTGLYSYNYAVANLIQNYPDDPAILPFRRVLESMLLAMHVPTYVHSCMVSELSVLIGQRLMDVMPECFVGELADRVEDVGKKREEILDFLRYAGLFHDIGKFYCMDVITQYARRLTETEFDIIHLHAECGFEILNRHASTAPYAEAALMHHITYDRRGGYDNRFMPVVELYKTVSDIVRIADAIDAATDNIGRCYSASKTQEQIMEELLATPHGYNPSIMEAIADEETQRTLAQALLTTRASIYESACLPVQAANE